jgi:hypothetical protein
MIVPKDNEPSAAGTLNMHVIEAKIHNDHDWISKMDPYLLAITKSGKRYKTETA